MTWRKVIRGLLIAALVWLVFAVVFFGWLRSIGPEASKYWP